MCSPQQQQQPTNTSQTTSNIPDWAIPSATKNLGRAEALTDINQNPYQTYQGNRVADFNPLQNQAFTNVAGMTTNTGTGNAMNQTQDTYNRSANAAPYNAQNFGNQYGSGPQFQNMGLGYLSANAPELNQYQMGPAERVRSQNFGQQSAQDYISPYQQFVTNFQKEEAVRDYNRGAPAAGAGASRAGAFGGSRQAIVESEANRNLQNQLGGIQAAGSQNAYMNAQQQFNADQARRMQSQMANQQAGLTVGQQNLQSQLQTQALGSGQSMQAQLANQGAYGQMQGLGMQQNLSANQQAMQNAAQRAQYGLSGQQAREQSRQFGANYGLQNRQQALAAAGQLGTLGQQQYAQQMGINAAQQQAGAQMQAQEQQGLSNKYQDFLNQQNYPYKQIGFMSDIIRGTPTSGGAQSMYQAPPSAVGQIAGLGLAGYGLSNAFKSKEGGAIQSYKHGGTVRHFASGGIASLLPDPETELAAKSKLPPVNQAMALAKFMLPAINRMHQPIARPRTTTVAEDMAMEILSRNQSPQIQQQPPQSVPPQQPQQGMPPQQPQGPTMMAAKGGLTSLPNNYNGGGIIAFSEGKTVSNPEGDDNFVADPATGLMVLKSETRSDQNYPPDMSSAALFQRAIEEQQRLRGQYKPPIMTDEIKSAREAQQQAFEAAGITGNIGDKRQKQLEDLQATEGSRKKEAFNNFLISTGLGMASEASKTGRPQSGILGALTQPLSFGAAQAFPGFMNEQKEIRGLIDSRNKELAELDSMRRAEASGIAKIAQSSFDKKANDIKAVDLKLVELASKRADAIAVKEAATAGKLPHEMTEYVHDFILAAREGGSKKSNAVLGLEGRDAYLKLRGLEGAKLAGVGVQARGQDITAITAAIGQEGVDNRAAQDAADRYLKSTLGTLAIFEAQDKDTKNKRDGTPTTFEKDLRENAFRDALRNIRSPTRPGQLPRVTAPAAAPPAAASRTYSQADLDATVKSSGRTEQEVKAAYAAKGMVFK